MQEAYWYTTMPGIICGSAIVRRLSDGLVPGLKEGHSQYQLKFKNDSSAPLKYYVVANTPGAKPIFKFEIPNGGNKETPTSTEESWLMMSTKTCMNRGDGSYVPLCVYDPPIGHEAMNWSEGVTINTNSELRSYFFPVEKFKKYTVYLLSGIKDAPIWKDEEFWKAWLVSRINNLLICSAILQTECRDAIFAEFVTYVKRLGWEKKACYEFLGRFKKAYSLQEGSWKSLVEQWD